MPSVRGPAYANAAETLLVNAAVAEKFLPVIARKLAEAGVELRGCERSRKIFAGMKEGRRRTTGRRNTFRRSLQ